MPQLISPGVDVSVIDESFYAGANQGTIPCIFIATHESKPTPSNDGIAAGTLRSKAGDLYLITSQRELAQTFGDPVFYRSGGTPVHGDELNEWGLLTAYQYLGIASRAYVLRANIDLASLTPRANPPTGIPNNGDYWFDINQTNWGLFSYSGTSDSFVQRNPLLIDTPTKLHYVYQDRRYGGSRAPIIGRSVATTVDTLGNDIIDTAGDLVINGTTVAVNTGDSIVDVVARINDAGIDNVRAHVVAHAVPTDGTTSEGEPENIPGVEVIFKLTSVNKIDFTGSNNDVLGALGVRSGKFGREPAWNLGSEGDIAIVTYRDEETFDNRIFEKITSHDAVRGDEFVDVQPQWMWVGSKTIDANAVPAQYWNWQAAVPTIAELSNPGFELPPTGSFDVVVVNENGDEVSATIDFSTLDTNSAGNVTADSLLVAINNNATLVENGVIAAFGDQVVVEGETVTEFFINNWKGGRISFTNESGGVLTGIGLSENTIHGPRQYHTKPHTFSPSYLTVGDLWTKTTTPNRGANYVVKIYSAVTGQWNVITVPFYPSDEAAIAGFGSALTVGNVYVRYDVYGDGTAASQLRRYDGTRWVLLDYEASLLPPAPPAATGSLWYDYNFRADFLVSTGSNWVGYRNRYPGTDIMFSASMPKHKPNGEPLIEHDIWIDTTDLETYPKIYRWRTTNAEWEIIDTTDQSSPTGILFADARADDGLGNDDLDALLSSNDVDADAPNALTYPDGLILWNTRWSGGNVKQWVIDHNVEGELIGDRWVTVSGNRHDGAPYMFRKAQRIMIVRAFAESMAENEDVKADTVFFNLMAAPGYPELLDEMNALNLAKKQIAFIVGDPPMRLKPTATQLQNWALNTAEAPSSGEDGLLRQSGYEYVGIYYPWGLSVDNDGYEVMVPPSTMVLRTMAYNDQVSYPWMAPAGYNRGLVSNATTVGYLNDEGEFKTVILSQGQKDVLYLNDINPIAYIPNRGLVVMGQKTLYAQDSALDRVNVARLVNYLRWHLNLLAQPFLFENNNFHTRDAARITFERFLSDLIGLQALYDFIVVCDETNNYGVRIDRNELWIDAGIQPQKSIEFIYVPVRILNTDADLTSFQLNSAARA